MILGGLTFDWNPKNFTIPRAVVPTKFGRSMSLVDVLRYPAALAGQTIILEWDWMPEGQYDALFAVHATTGANLEWNPVAGVAGTDQYWYDAPTQSASIRYYFGAYEYEGSDTGSQGYPTWWYVGMSNLYIGDDWYNWVFDITGLGDHWVEVIPSYWPQGAPIPAYDHPYGVIDGGLAYLVSPADPWRTLSVYPYASYPDRCWYTRIAGGAITMQPGDVVYDDYNYCFRWVTAVGPDAYNNGESSWFDSILATSAQHASYAWQDGNDLEPWVTYAKDTSYSYGVFLENPTDGSRYMSIKIDPAYHAIPGVPVSELAQEYDVTYLVRSISLSGNLFRTAHYEQPYRKDVRLKLLVRGVA